MSLEAGQVVDGKYRITRLLGEGGMGAVYEGENVRIHRKVAIKVLHAAFTENQEVVQRFEREAQAAGHIGNDHILEVLDLGQLADGDLYLVMEYLDGEALSDRVRRLGRMTAEQVVPLMLEVLEGLGAAHAAGIIHRDLKPDNIFILKEKAGHKDFVKIIDFGISKFQPLSGDGMRMTKTGAMMGTPYYMSPEQATGSRDADQRSDIYALGVIIYECVTGTVPFDAPSFNQLLFKIALTAPPPIEEMVPDIDPGFASIVTKAMAREVEARFTTCDDLAAALKEWSRSKTGVSVPPPVSEEAMRASVVAGDGIAPAPALPIVTPVGSVPGGGKTAGSWSSTQPDAAASRGPLLAAVAGVALLVLGGGAYLAFGGSGGDAAAAAQAAQNDETAKAAAAALEAAKRAQAEVAEARKEAEEEKQKAAEVAAEAAAKAESAAELAKEVARKAEEEKAQEAAKAAAVRRVAPVRKATAAPAAAPKPAAPAPKPAPAGGGDMDFGY